MTLPRLRRRTIIVSVVLALALGVMLLMRHRQAPVPAAEAVSVAVAAATAGPLAAQMRAVGAVTALREATVSVKISGQILQMPLLQNKSVRTGDVLARLESKDLLAQRREAAAAVAEAETAVRATAGGSIPESTAQAERNVADARARFETARRLYERRRDLYAAGGIAQKDLEASRLDLTTSENDLRLAEQTLALRKSTLNATDRQSSISRLDAARQRLAFADAQSSYAIIRSPLDGVVVEQFQFQGDFVTAGTNLVKVADLSRLVVKVAVPDTVASSIREGDTATVFPAEQPDKPITAPVRLVSRGENAASRTVEVWVELPGGQRGARPGSAAAVVLAYGAKKSVVSVPESAVVLDATTGNSGAVMTVDRTGTARERKVVTGIRAAGRIEIVSGLAPGELVITEGNYGLPDGTKVSVRR